MSRKIIAPMFILVSFFLNGQLEAQEIYEESRNLYSTKELGSSIEATANSEVIIKSASTLQGTMKISTSDEDEIRVFYAKKARTDSRSTAIDYIDQIAVHLGKGPGRAKVELRAPNPAPWTEREAGFVEITLVVPESCRVDIDALYFDIEAEGPFETFVVPSSLGQIDVTHVTSELDVTTSNQRVSIENITGKIQVSTSNASLTARNIKSTGGRAEFHNEGSDIKIFGVSGDIDVKNSYGRTVIDMFEAVGDKSYIKSHYGPIEILMSSVGAGQLIVTNRYEDIELSLPSDVSAEFSLAVEEEGKIEVSNLPFKPDLVQRNRLNLVAGDGAALISGSVRGKGNVYIRAYDPED